MFGKLYKIVCTASVSASFFCLLTFPTLSFALKMQPHPIEDLIEGDERTPPKGKYIVEERAATPVYRLPNMSRFPQEKAIETFPQMSKQEVSKEAASQFEDEWSEWSSWDQWNDTDEWNSWDETSAEKASPPPADSSNASTVATDEPPNTQAEENLDETHWDSWVSTEEKT